MILETNHKNNNLQHKTLSYAYGVAVKYRKFELHKV